MNIPLPLFNLASPEIFILIMATVCLLADLFLKTKRKQITYALVLIALFGAAILSVSHFDANKIVTFYGHFIFDPMATIMKLFMLFGVFFIFIYGRSYLCQRQIPYGEFLSLALLSTLGMMVLVSAGSLLTLYLGIELMAFPIYTMIALERNSESASEAAIKYFVTGALASGMILYGFSILYGLTGSLLIANIAHHLSAYLPYPQLVVAIFALVFVVAGMAFKLGVVPFHMWIPDVYSGSSNLLTLFISSAPKIAAMGLAIRLLIQTVPSLHVQWQEMLIILAILSMLIGNVVAIMQTNLKRMLAYSTIAHSGYMSLGLIAANAQGVSSSIFYILTYMLMSLLAFGMLVMLSDKEHDFSDISALKGMHQRAPYVAFLFLLVMFSMAGIPPLVGFFAKLGVIEALLHAKLVWLAVVALLLSVVGAFYYIRIVKVMYFENAEDTAAISYPFDTRIALSVNGFLVLGLGLFPYGLFNLCRLALNHL